MHGDKAPHLTSPDKKERERREHVAQVSVEAGLGAHDDEHNQRRGEEGDGVEEKRWRMEDRRRRIVV